MRALLTFLIAAAIGLGFLLVGCGGDEEPPQQAQTEQESAAQDESQSAAGQARSAQSSPEASADDEQPVAQDAADEESTEPTESGDPLLADAIAALDAWTADLETMILDLRVGFSLFGLGAEIEAVGVYRAEPLGVLVTMDMSALLAVAQAFSDTDDEQLDEPLLLRLLVDETTAYLSLPGLGGWVEQSEFPDGALGELSALPGGDPASLVDPSGLRQTLGCVEAAGGVVTLGQYDGEDVWLVDCTIDVAAATPEMERFLQEMGVDPIESGIETFHTRMAISRTSGAPLLIESISTLADPFGLASGDDADEQEDAASQVTSVATLRSWNEPVEFPTPEPLVDPALLDDFFGEDGASDAASDPGSGATFASSELLTADELIVLASEWLDTVDELQVQIEGRAIAGDDSRDALTTIATSRSRGSIEVITVLDRTHVFGLLWNRDGIWVGEGRSEDFGYQPSTPELQGFAGLTVDEFLAQPDLYNIGSYATVLDLSWLTRTIEGAGPPIYELVIESGPRWPGDDFFAELVDLIKAEASEFLAESSSIESIEYYSTVFTINGASGEVISQDIAAEFRTDEVDMLFTASIFPLAGGPIEFSNPAN